MQWKTPGGRGRLPGWKASAVTLAATALLAAGCGGLSGSGQPAATGGSLAASGINLQGQTFTVGGKDFDEQLFLCKAQVEALQSVGATVNDRCGIQGSAAARAALTSGQIDMYWSYTGTGWITDLKQTQVIKDPMQQYLATANLDKQQNNIVWTNPTPFNNTYAIAHHEGVRGPEQHQDHVGLGQLHQLRQPERHALRGARVRRP